MTKPLRIEVDPYSASCLDLGFDWNTPLGESDTCVDFSSSATISQQLQLKGIRILLFHLPFGTFRCPVEDDAEWLLDCYREVEDICKGSLLATKCVLADGAVQFDVKSLKGHLNFHYLVVPRHDGRFATSFEMTLPNTTALRIWRTLARKLVSHSLR